MFLELNFDFQSLSSVSKAVLFTREGLFKELRVCSTELGIQDLVKF